MVETGKYKPQGVVRSRPNGGDGRQRADGGVYTSEDASHFERLNDAVRLSAGPQRLGTAPVEAVPETSAFDYTECDARAFDRLMGELAGTRTGQRGLTANQRGAGQGFGYTGRDDDAFSKLMAADRFPASHTSQMADPAPAPARTESAFQFTAQDDAEFRKIVSGTPIGPELDQAGAGDGPFRRDRDVGPIRIVDFDKENARAREGSQGSNTNIKVRYFE